MTSQEAFTSVNRGSSRRSLDRARQEQQRERKEQDEVDRLEAVAEFLITLEIANTTKSLSSTLEIVYPKTTFGRLLSPHKNRMIPATTSHTYKFSDFSGQWHTARKITAQYLLSEFTDGYLMPTENDDSPHFFVFNDVIMPDGRIGTLLKPVEEQSGIYQYADETVRLYDYTDVFESTTRQKVWGPSLTKPDQLSAYHARVATQGLVALMVGTQF